MTNFIVFPVCVFSLGVFVDDISGESVFVTEGDSVTLHTDVKTNQQEKIKWYFNDTRITQITGDLSDICTDVQCNEGTERFRDRLKLDHQTGSLTIMNITNTDSGVYHLQIISSTISDKIFSVVIHGVPAAKRDEMQRKTLKEGESFTFDPGDIKNTDDVMMWYFNNTLIAEITGDQSKICTDDECKERFRDRLKLDHQTGSLTIMNIRTTDSGLYKLKISSRSFIIHRHRSISIISEKNFSVTNRSVLLFVTTGICVAVLLVLAGLIGKRCRRRKSGIPKNNSSAVYI
uniref:Immunoglobulin domain-containing protein n=1 Tax=Cyprinus carpio TaxID=7962 RepID=A0A8C1KG93_CYPCA